MTRTFLAAAALACALAAPAFAETATAQLQSPLAAPAKVIAGGAVWNCSGDACVTQGATDATYDPGACRELARAVGPVSTYGGSAKLDAAHLAKCDKGLVAAPVIAKAAATDVATR